MSWRNFLSEIATAIGMFSTAVGMFSAAVGMFSTAVGVVLDSSRYVLASLLIGNCTKQTEIAR